MIFLDKNLSCSQSLNFSMMILLENIKKFGILKGQIIL